jgi:hypothetical protein
MKKRRRPAFRLQIVSPAGLGRQTLYYGARMRKWFVFVLGPLVAILIMFFIAGLPPFAPFDATCHASHPECVRRFTVILCLAYPISVGVTWLFSLAFRVSR